MCVRFNLLKIREYFRKLFAIVSYAVPVTTLKAYSRLSTETYTSVVYGKHTQSTVSLCMFNRSTLYTQAILYTIASYENIVYKTFI